jgi:hypothetical protein
MRTLSTALVATLGLLACGKKEPPPEPPPPFAPLELAVGESKEGVITLATTGEAILRLTGTATGAQWGKKGAEALAVRVTLNNRLTRELLWVTGAVELTFGVALGKLDAGEQNIKVEVVPALSRNEAGAKLSFSKAELVAHEDPALARYAPLLLGKDESNYNDLPVLLYGSKTATGYRYTVVYTNEDGGTGLNPRLLMAQWARLSDIEWAYEVDLDSSGKVTAARYQGRNHVTTVHTGPKQDEHPLLRVDGVNGLFSDDGAVGSYTFAPEVLAFDDKLQQRERVLDANPWIYTLVDGEGIREGKVDASCADLAKAWPSYCYLYVDGEVTSLPDLGDRHLYGLEALPTGGDVTQSELDLGASGRLGRLGPVRLAVPVKKEAALTAVRLYAAPDGQGDFQIFLKSPRGMRLVDGVAKEVFSKPGANVKVTQLQTQTTFGP